MNTNILTVLRQIVNDYGEDILNNPKRVRGLMADMAAGEPKAEKKALGACFEKGFYTELKNAVEPEEQKITLVNRLHYEEGFDLELCEDSVDIIAVLAGVQDPVAEITREKEVKVPKTMYLQRQIPAEEENLKKRLPGTVWLLLIGLGIAIIVGIVRYNTTSVDNSLNDESPRPGEVLFYSYTVQRGDTLYEIAKSFGLSTSTLISVNNIRTPNYIEIGFTLVIPSQDGILHPVQSGETMEAIARMYNVDANVIMNANQVFPNEITVNFLFIPGVTF
jgi:LysM repeat protein